MNYHITLLRKKALRLLYLPLGMALLFTALGSWIVGARVPQYSAEASMISGSGNFEGTPYVEYSLVVSSYAIAPLAGAFRSNRVLELAAMNLREEGWLVSAHELEANTIRWIARNNLAVKVTSENPDYAVAAANAHSEAFVRELNGILGWEVINMLDYSEAPVRESTNDPALIVLAFSLFGLCLGLPLMLWRVFYDNKIAVCEDLLISTPSEQIVLIPRFDIK